MSKPDLIHEGLTWKDMPGNCTFNKRATFSLFRHGKVTKQYVLSTAEQKRSKNWLSPEKRAAAKRRLVLQQEAAGDL